MPRAGRMLDMHSRNSSAIPIEATERQLPRNRHAGATLGNRGETRCEHAAAAFTGTKPMLESVLIALLFSFLTYYVTFEL